MNNTEERCRKLAELIRDVPDYPKKGILFKDITTLLKDSRAMEEVTDIFAEKYRDINVDKIVGIEARGFIFGALLAVKLGAGFVPARKPGKLPWKTIKREYDLEYGSNTLEMHIDGIEKGETVVIIDDLLATGGTAKAVAGMVAELGGDILGIDFLAELGFLNGRDKLKEYPVTSYLLF